MPKNSNTIKYLYGDNNGDRRSKPQKLEEIVKIGLKKRNQEVEERWDEFCLIFLKYFPEEEEGIKKLWPYISRRLMKKEDLPEHYFEYLKGKEVEKV